MSASDTGSWLGRSLVHHGKCSAPTVEPTTNPASVITMAVWPLPIANSVPDAHEPPSCMPTPNRNDPTNRPTPIGASEAAAGTPFIATPEARIGANNVQATASISMCARSALPWRTATSCRQAEVKPNRLWNSTKPSATPIPNNRAGTWPERLKMKAPRKSAATAPATTTLAWGAGASTARWRSRAGIFSGFAAGARCGWRRT